MNKKATVIIISIIALLVVSYYILVPLLAIQTSNSILDDFKFTNDVIEQSNKDFEKRTDSILKEINRMKNGDTTRK